MAKQFLLQRETLIHADIQAVWAFFSDPRNLIKLSPTYLDFKVMHCPDVAEVYSGMTIGYKVSPLLKIPMRWESLIRDVVRLRQFRDIQTKGPYKSWVHTHLFGPVSDGVLMKDEVVYEMPLGIFGTWAHELLVAKQLHQLFDYRTGMIRSIFP